MNLMNISTLFRCFTCAALLLSLSARADVITSTFAGGRWADVATWQAGRVPGAGDSAVIAGPVTVDALVTVGVGTNDAIVVTTKGRLTVATPLLVRGGIRCEGRPVIEVQPGGGIELDADAGATPRIHAAYGSGLNLRFTGTPQQRCFLRTRSGTAGLPGRIAADGNYVPINLSSAYADFCDLGSSNTWGITVLPSADAGTGCVTACTFTRTSLRAGVDKGALIFSNVVFSATPLVPTGDARHGVRFEGALNFDLEACGFDAPVWLDQPRRVTSCVFLGNFSFNPYHHPTFGMWSDNLASITEPSSGYVKALPGLYRRSYWICPVPDVYNPHMVFVDAGEATFEHCIWDAPLSSFVDDALDTLGKTPRKLVVRNSLCLPRIAGSHPGCGISLGYICAHNAWYEHNTIALGQSPGIHSDVSHGGLPGCFALFRDNLCWQGKNVPGTGVLFGVDYPDAIAASNCHHNAFFNAGYGVLPLSTGTPGAGDVQADPRFVDPTRNMSQFYWNQVTAPSAQGADVILRPLDWLRQHPERMPEMIDWVFAGYVPGNPALKAADNPDGPTRGWIGAMPGN